MAVLFTSPATGQTEWKQVRAAGARLGGLA